MLLSNVRQINIKNVAAELIEKFPSQFNDDFQQNKKKVAELTNVQSKMLRNRIAGYVTTLLRVQKQKKKPYAS